MKNIFKILFLSAFFTCCSSPESKSYDLVRTYFSDKSNPTGGSYSNNLSGWSRWDFMNEKIMLSYGYNILGENESRTEGFEIKNLVLEHDDSENSIGFLMINGDAIATDPSASKGAKFRILLRQDYMHLSISRGNWSHYLNIDDEFDLIGGESGPYSFRELYHKMKNILSDPDLDFCKYCSLPIDTSIEFPKEFNNEIYHSKCFAEANFDIGKKCGDCGKSIFSSEKYEELGNYISHKSCFDEINMVDEMSGEVISIKEFERREQIMANGDFVEEMILEGDAALEMEKKCSEENMELMDVTRLSVNNRIVYAFLVKTKEKKFPKDYVMPNTMVLKNYFPDNIEELEKACIYYMTPWSKDVSNPVDCNSIEKMVENWEENFIKVQV